MEREMQAREGKKKAREFVYPRASVSQIHVNMNPRGYNMYLK